jgi:hypothetical protein
MPDHIAYAGQKLDHQQAMGGHIQRLILDAINGHRFQISRCGFDRARLYIVTLSLLRNRLSRT